MIQLIMFYLITAFLQTSHSHKGYSLFIYLFSLVCKNHSYHRPCNVWCRATHQRWHTTQTDLTDKHSDITRKTSRNQTWVQSEQSWPTRTKCSLAFGQCWDIWPNIGDKLNNPDLRLERFWCPSDWTSSLIAHHTQQKYLIRLSLEPSW